MKKRKAFVSIIAALLAGLMLFSLVFSSLGAVFASAASQSDLDALEIGMTSLKLGGGRITKESVVDLSVGVVLHKKVGDPVEQGESLATIHAADETSAKAAVEQYARCVTISAQEPEKVPFIKGIVR